MTLMISTLPAVGRPVAGTNIAREIFTSTRFINPSDLAREPAAQAPDRDPGSEWEAWGPVPAAQAPDPGQAQDRDQAREQDQARDLVPAMARGQARSGGRSVPARSAEQWGSVLSGRSWLSPRSNDRYVSNTARYGRASHMRLHDTARIRFAPAALVGRTQDISFDPLHELGDGGSDDLGAGANDPVIPGNRAQREVADERLRCFKL